MTKGDGRGTTLDGIAFGVTAAALARRGGFFYPDVLVIPVALAGCALARRRRAGTTDGRFCLALVALAALWVGRGASAGTAGRALSLGGALLALGATYHLGRTTRARAAVIERALVVIASGTNLVAVLGWALRRQPFGLVFDGAWRLAGPFAYPNTAGLFAALALIVAVGTQSVPRKFQHVAVLVAAMTLTASLSRGGFVAAAVGLTALPFGRVRAAAAPLALAVALGAAASTVARTGDAQAWIVAALAGAALVVLVWPGAVTDRLSRAGATRAVLAVAAMAAVTVTAAVVSDRVIDVARDRSGTASLEDRSAEWAAAWRAGSERPLIGSGPERDLVIHNFRGEAVARYAHNEALQIFAGAGLAGVSLLVVVLATGGWALRTRPRRSPVATATALALLVGGLIDFSWHFVGITAFAGWALALDRDATPTAAGSSEVAPPRPDRLGAAPAA